MAAINANMDISKLEAMWEELKPKRRIQAMKAALRREGNQIKRQAQTNLAQVEGGRGNKSLHNARALGRGIYVKVYRKKAGFSVTIRPKSGGRGRDKGMYTNSRGQRKPVLLWAELGTRPRTRRHLGGYTGYMRSYAFMAKTRAEVEAEGRKFLGDELKKQVIKICKKYGCK